MSQLRSKFRKSIGILQNAVRRTVELDSSQPKLYKKVKRFYEEEGVRFTGDSVEDYQIILDCIQEDLTVGVAQ